MNNEATNEIPELRSEFMHTAAQCRANIDRLTAPMTHSGMERLAAKRGLTLAEFIHGRASAVSYWRASLAAIVRECPNV